MAESEIGERVVIQYPSNRITHGTHHMLQGALRPIRVGTIGAFLVGCFADAANWSERAVKNAYDLTERDVPWWLNKGVPPLHPSSAGEKSGSLEGEKNLLQEFNRDVLASRNVVTL